jgi:hypothetical protein
MDFLNSLLQNPVLSNHTATPSSSIASEDDASGSSVASLDSESEDKPVEQKRKKRVAKLVTCRYMETLVTVAGMISRDPKHDAHKVSSKFKKKHPHFMAHWSRIEQDVEAVMKTVYDKAKKYDNRRLLKALTFISCHSTIQSISWRENKVCKIKCLLNNEAIGNCAVQIKADVFAIYLNAIKARRATPGCFKQFRAAVSSGAFADKDIPAVKHIKISKEKLIDLLAIVQFASYRLVTSPVYVEEDMTPKDIFDKYELLRQRVLSFNKNTI